MHCVNNEILSTAAQFYNKSSAVAEMGDRLATLDRAENWQLGPPFRGRWAGSPSNTMAPGPGLYLHTKWHLDPSIRLATIDMGRKLGELCLFWGDLGSNLIQSRLGRGLSPY